MPPATGKPPAGGTPRGKGNGSSKDDAVTLKICRAYCKHGACQKGTACPFAHVTGLPEAIVKKVFAKPSLTISSLGDAAVLGSDGVYKYTSTPANDQAVLASISAAAADDTNDDAEWPLIGCAATDEEIDKILAESRF